MIQVKLTMWRLVTVPANPPFSSPPQVEGGAKLDSLYPQCRNRDDGDDGKESGDVATELCRGLCVGAHDYRKAKLTCVKFYVRTHIHKNELMETDRQ